MATAGRWMVPFEHDEDGERFEALVCRSGETLDGHADLFDLGDPVRKRRDAQRAQPRVLAALLETHGPSCMLRLPGVCVDGPPWTVDHVIPLSTNVLNEELRHLAAEPGREVAAQSFGSNHPTNLALACAPCNGAKRHVLLEPAEVQRILDRIARREAPDPAPDVALLAWTIA